MRNFEGTLASPKLAAMQSYTTAAATTAVRAVLRHHPQSNQGKEGKSNAGSELSWFSQGLMKSPGILDAALLIHGRPGQVNADGHSFRIKCYSVTNRMNSGANGSWQPAVGLNLWAVHGSKKSVTTRINSGEDRSAFEPSFGSPKLTSTGCGHEGRACMRAG